MTKTYMLYALIALGLMLIYPIPAQTTSPAVKTQELDHEATEVMSALQDQAKSLPAQRKLEYLNSLVATSVPGRYTPPSQPSSGSALTFVTSPQGLLQTDPHDLSLNQKMQAIQSLIEANRNTVQQVVIGGPSTPAAVNVATHNTIVLATMLNSLSVAGTKLLSASDLAGLAAKVKSIGRILWTYQSLLDKGDPQWQLAGTGFISAPGVVTTACHVASVFGDVSSGQPKLKANVVVRMDFSDTTASGTLLPITGIVTLSDLAACDVAQLSIQGADGLVPLSVAPATSATKRIMVVGYPMLDNYRLVNDCSTEGTLTDTQFCNFVQSNPSSAKVASPGKVLIACCADNHGSVSVLTYDAPTTGGQSGSPVFDADTLQVIGVHYCCKDAQPSTTTLNCDNWHAQNPAWNEAVLIQSILTDSTLKSHFSDVAASRTAAWISPAFGGQVSPHALSLLAGQGSRLIPTCCKCALKKQVATSEVIATTPDQPIKRGSPNGYQASNGRAEQCLNKPAQTLIVPQLASTDP